MIKNILLALIIILNIYGCKDTHLDNIKKLTSKEIIIPDSLYMVQQEHKILPQEHFMSSKYKFISYIDSSKCLSCKLSYMYLWNNFLLLDSLSNGELKFYFIINPKQEDKYNINNLYHLSNFNYPIFIDTARYFVKENPNIPNSSIYHSFLIDSYGKILFIGNPTYTKQLSELFFKTISKLLNLDLQIK